ncbi:MAG: lectin-like protein [Pseudomonadota bacterium]
MALTRIVSVRVGADLFVFASEDGPIKWTKAARAAAKFDGGDGHLATVTNARQSNALQDAIDEHGGGFVGASGPWIGLARAPDDDFEWVTGEAFRYSNWSPGEPNNFVTPERWVQLWNGQAIWNDNDQSFPRESVFGYVVELRQKAANVINGTAGDDHIESGGGADRLKGRGGDDVLIAGAGKDRMQGQGGDDRLVGGPGDDLMQGQAGADVLLGGGGKDRLIGGGGDDVLTGGKQADVFVFTARSGADVIKDFRVGLDVIELKAANRLGDLSFEQVGDDVTVAFRGAQITVENVEEEALRNSQNFDL